MRLSAIFYYVVFSVSALVMVTLLVVGFCLPPQGEIHPSVIQASGELIGLAVLAQVPHILSIVSKGHHVKLSKGNFTVEAKGVNDESKQ